MRLVDSLSKPTSPSNCPAVRNKYSKVDTPAGRDGVSLVHSLTEPDARLGFTLSLATAYAARDRVTTRSPVAIAKQAARHPAPNQSAPRVFSGLMSSAATVGPMLPPSRATPLVSTAARRDGSASMSMGTMNGRMNSQMNPKIAASTKNSGAVGRVPNIHTIARSTAEQASSVGYQRNRPANRVAAVPPNT